MRPETQNPQEEIYSSATIKGHPIHPMAVVFPIASLVGVFVSDLVYLFTNDIFWTRASYWLILAGVITGIGAALFGLTDFLLNSRIRRLRVAWLHAAANLTLIFLAMTNMVLRNQNEVDSIVPWGIVLSFATVVLLTISGWYGGELVYHHKVGIDSRKLSKENTERVPTSSITDRADLS
jgi:uncharacterized membrane protein